MEKQAKKTKVKKVKEKKESKFERILAEELAKAFSGVFGQFGFKTNLSDNLSTGETVDNLENPSQEVK